MTITVILLKTLQQIRPTGTKKLQGQEQKNTDERNKNNNKQKKTKRNKRNKDLNYIKKRNKN